MRGQQAAEAHEIALRRPASSGTSRVAARLLLSFLLLHSADAFLPPLAPSCGSSYAAPSGIAGARALGKQTRSPAGRLSLRMEGDAPQSGGEDLWALQRQKERLLAEQRALDKQKRELSKKVAAPAAVATPVCALSCTHHPKGPADYVEPEDKLPVSVHLLMSL